MTAGVLLQLSTLSSKAFRARPPPAALVDLAEPSEEAPAGEGALALKKVTERNDSYLISVSYCCDSADDFGEHPWSLLHRCASVIAWNVLHTTPVSSTG